ncbi:MAG TPA: hypothetical protein VND65_00225 [Candidatus Binatia bacterium]|nr:hypothetical protein [Candidatus Binatia bacterium]
MAAGAAPALEKKPAQQENKATLPPQPRSFMERLAHKLTEIFERNEENGVTRV